MAITQEERDRRRERIYQTKPWEKSTGAKTEFGKLVVSQNALKHGFYSNLPLNRMIARAERERELIEIFSEKVLKVVKVKNANI